MMLKLKFIIVSNIETDDHVQLDSGRNMSDENSNFFLTLCRERDTKKHGLVLYIFFIIIRYG